MNILYLFTDTFFIFYFSYIFLNKKNDEYRMILPFIILTLLYFLYRKYFLYIKTKKMKVLKIAITLKFTYFVFLTTLIAYSILTIINKDLDYNLTFLYVILSFSVLENLVFYNNEKLIYKYDEINFDQVVNAIIFKNRIEVKFKYKNDISKLSFISKDLMKKTYNLIEKNKASF